MKKSFLQLQELYVDLSCGDGEPASVENPCGDCYSCCQAQNMQFHRVSPLEFDYLEEMVGKDKTDRFRAYISRRRDERGNLRYPVCPNYGEHGCTVHQYRPYSCRMYGTIRTDRQKLIAHCVFKDSVKVIPHEQEKDLLPHNRRLQKIMVEHLLTSGAVDELHPVEFDEETTDPASLGTYYLSLGDYKRAAQALEKAVEEQPDEPLYAWELSQAYEGLERREDALLFLQEATLREPDNATYQQSLANCLLLLGRVGEATGVYETVCQLNPSHVSARGMLAIGYVNLGRIQEAVYAFQRTLTLETEPTIYRYQFAQLLHRLGEVEAARSLYQAALECPFTERDAQAALSAFAPSAPDTGPDP